MGLPSTDLPETAKPPYVVCRRALTWSPLVTLSSLHLRPISRWRAPQPCGWDFRPNLTSP